MEQTIAEVLNERERERELDACTRTQINTQARAVWDFVDCEEIYALVIQFSCHAMLRIYDRSVKKKKPVCTS